MTWDETEIRRVENGYVVKYGKHVLNKESIFRTFNELVGWLEDYFDDALEASS